MDALFLFWIEPRGGVERDVATYSAPLSAAPVTHTYDSAAPSTTATGYDADGHVVSTVDAIGSTTSLTYDITGRPVVANVPRTSPGSVASCFATQTTYDANDV